MFSGRVDGDVAGVGSARRNFIQECQLTGAAIDGEGADASAVGAVVVLYFIHRVQKMSIRVDREPGGVRGFRGKPERSDFLCGGVIAISVNTFALAPVFGVGTDVKEIFTLQRGGG